MTAKRDLGERFTWDGEAKVWTYRLLEPVEIAGEDVSVVRFRHVRPMDMDHFSTSGEISLGDIRLVLWAIAKKYTEPVVLERLDTDDYMQLTDAVGKFLAPAHPTGETGSAS